MIRVSVNIHVITSAATQYKMLSPSQLQLWQYLNWQADALRYHCYLNSSQELHRDTSQTVFTSRHAFRLAPATRCASTLHRLCFFFLWWEGLPSEIAPWSAEAKSWFSES